MKPSKRVLVALNMSNISGQRKLAGIFKYLHGRSGNTSPWDMQIIRTRTEFSKQCMRKAIANGTDGYIVSIPDSEETVDLLRTVDKPAVTMDVMPPQRRSGLVVIRNDNESAGRLAASTLLQQGHLRHYAFAHSSPVLRWGTEREAAFRAAIRDAGFWCDTYGAPGETRDLDAFLHGLPKPCGVFAANDACGYRVLVACRRLGLRVPSEISVIGVDNDALLCEHCTPPLTSISANFEREGYLAAQALGRMMSARRGAQTQGVSVINVPITEIVRRESTAGLSPAGLLVQRAVAYITTNALRGIGVADVVQHLRVSRRLADLRFRQLQGRTIHDAISEIRIEKVKDLLRTTDESIDDIAYRCGYPNANYLRNLFKRLYGTSMRDYRKRIESPGGAC